MQHLVLLLLATAAYAQHNVFYRPPFINPAGITLTGTMGYAHTVGAAFPAPHQYAAVAPAPAPVVGHHLHAVQHIQPVTSYAAVPTAQKVIGQIPAVAQVPVTKFQAQPVVYQNEVDVAK